MQKVVQDAVNKRAQELLEALGEDTQQLISNARRDLHSGPLYLDEDGDVVSPFDEDAIRFDFPGAVDTLSDAFDALEGLMTFYVDDEGFTYDSDPRDDEDNWEEGDEEDEMEYVGPQTYYIIEPADVIKAMVGKELADYI